LIYVPRFDFHFGYSKRGVFFAEKVSFVRKNKRKTRKKQLMMGRENEVMAIMTGEELTNTVPL
jgi:hypothetical protein